MPHNRWAVRLATCLLACLAVAGLVGVLLRIVRVHRPPTPAAANLPANARALLQPFRKDSLDLTVASHAELNYRVGMQAGATLVYAWSTAPPGAMLSYESADQRANSASAAHSAFVAQSAGWYRWRWKNDSSRPVIIHFKLSGYYEPAIVPPVGMPYDR